MTPFTGGIWLVFEQEEDKEKIPNNKAVLKRFFIFSVTQILAFLVCVNAVLCIQLAKVTKLLARPAGLAARASANIRG